MNFKSMKNITTVRQKITNSSPAIGGIYLYLRKSSHYKNLSLQDPSPRKSGLKAWWQRIRFLPAKLASLRFLVEMTPFTGWLGGRGMGREAPHSPPPTITTLSVSPRKSEAIERSVFQLLAKTCHYKELAACLVFSGPERSLTPGGFLHQTNSSYWHQNSR